MADESTPVPCKGRKPLGRSQSLFLLCVALVAAAAATLLALGLRAAVKQDQKNRLSQLQALALNALGEEDSTGALAFALGAAELDTSATTELLLRKALMRPNLVLRLSPGLGEITYLSFLGSRDRLIMATAQGPAILLNSRTGKQIATLSSAEAGIDLDGELYGIATSPEALIAVQYGFSRKVELWDLETGNKVRELGEHPERVIHASFSAESDSLLTLDQSGGLRLWEIDAGTSTDLPPMPSARWVQLAKTKPEYAIRHVSGALSIHDMSGGRLWEDAGGWSNFTAEYGGPGVHYSQTETARFWLASPSRFEALSSSYEPKGGGYCDVRTTASSADPTDDFLLVGCYGGRALIWQYLELDSRGQSGNKANKRFEPYRGEMPAYAHTGPISAVDISPDGVMAATADDNGWVRFWRLGHQDQDPRRDLFEARPTGESSVTALAFSDDSKHLAAGTKSGEIFVWSGIQEHEPLTFRHPKAKILGFDQSVDKGIVATFDADTTIRIWGLRSRSAMAAEQIDSGWPLAVKLKKTKAKEEDFSKVAVVDHSAALHDLADVSYLSGEPLEIGGEQTAYREKDAVNKSATLKLLTRHVKGARGGKDVFITVDGQPLVFNWERGEVVWRGPVDKDLLSSQTRLISTANSLAYLGLGKELYWLRTDGADLDYLGEPLSGQVDCFDLAEDGRLVYQTQEGLFSAKFERFGEEGEELHSDGLRFSSISLIPGREELIFGLIKEDKGPEKDQASSVRLAKLSNANEPGGARATFLRCRGGCSNSEAVIESPEGRYIGVLEGKRHFVRLWEVASGREVALLYSPSPLVEASISLDGDKVVALGKDGVFRVFMVDWDGLMEKARTVAKSLEEEEYIDPNLRLFRSDSLRILGLQ